MARIHIEMVARAPCVIVFDLARDLDFHTRSLEHTGEHIVGGRRGGLIELGEEVEWEARHFGLRLRLRSRISEMDRPRTFVDEQVRGPFRSFVHRHVFIADGDTTRMVDDWEHRAPLGFATDLVLRGYMSRLLTTRNTAIVAEAERRARSTQR
ncbi:MAG TPA: SRPBCC family protein [Polyangiaceae bacterium]|jgi:ligand-binding SRPBCC domain-containing protein